MNDQADNPYAAPQARPPPVPWSVYRRAAVAGAITFIVAYILAAVLVGFPAGVVFGLMNGNRPRIAEREEIVMYGVQGCCILAGVLFGALAARRKLRDPD